MDEEIIVSVCCITYNHVSYIKQCIDGFLMQKCNFRYEIIINDDCSTDGTTEILRKYESEYPELITVIYHKENEYQKGVRGMFQNYVFPKAKGRYLAFCEGDDYWIDPLKLQKQVDFLELHSDVSFVFTDRYIDNEINRVRKKVTYKNRKYTTEDILSGFNPGLQSVLMRNLPVLTLHNLTGINGDRLYPYLCSLYGSLMCINDVTSVYRVTGKGVSTSINEEIWFEHALRDFYTFHKNIGFPNNRCYLIGNVKYVSSYIRKNASIRGICRGYKTFRSINPKFNFCDYVRLLYYVIKNKCLNIIGITDIRVCVDV